MAELPPIYVIDNFNEASSVNSWFQMYCFVPLIFAYGSSADAGGGGPGSGSMKVSAGFSGDRSPGFALGRYLSGIPWYPSITIPATAYAYMSMDIRWDPGSTLDGDGTFGSIIIHAVDSANIAQYPESIVSTPAGITDWVHVVIPTPYIDSASDLGGFMFRLWEGQSSGPWSINGPVTFWIDNIELTNVPEPASFALLVGGGLFLAVFRRSGGRR